MSRKKIIALVLSLFVLPGMGHVYLGRKITGYAIGLVVTLILLTLLCFYEWDLIQAMKLQSDPSLFFMKFSFFLKKAYLDKAFLYNSGLVISLFVWIVSAIDVFRIKE